MALRGDQFYHQAEKKLTGFSLFSSKADKNNDAGELFKKAANAYKSVRDFSKAGDSFLRAAKCFEFTQLFAESASTASDASRMLAKSSSQEDRQKSIEAIQMAVRLYKETNKSANAAKLLVELAQSYSEIEDNDNAIRTLREAVQLYLDENNEIQAATQMELIGDILLKSQQYSNAAVEFKKISEIRMKDRLTQFSSGKFFMKTILCRLGDDDLVGAQRDFNDFTNLNPAWERSREGQLVRKTIQAIEDNSAEGIATASSEYDQINGNLEKWMIDILLAVKRRIEGDDEPDLT